MQSFTKADIELASGGPSCSAKQHKRPQQHSCLAFRNKPKIYKKIASYIQSPEVKSQVVSAINIDYLPWAQEMGTEEMGPSGFPRKPSFRPGWICLLYHYHGA